jgi:hypothetical protein
MAVTGDEKKKELRRVYRKLKGVRCQISMKLKELKKEVKEATQNVAQDHLVVVEEDNTVEAPTEEHICESEVKQERSFETAQSDVKVMLDHKRRLRKRFQKLQDEVRGIRPPVRPNKEASR